MQAIQTAATSPATPAPRELSAHEMQLLRHAHSFINIVEAAVRDYNAVAHEISEISLPLLVSENFPIARKAIYDRWKIHAEAKRIAEARPT